MSARKMSNSPIPHVNPMQVGPEYKEYNLLRGAQEYQNGNTQNTIYYLVKALFQSIDTRYGYLNEEHQKELLMLPKIDDILSEFNELEKADYKTNTFMQMCVTSLKEQEEKESSASARSCTSIESMNFLEDYTDAKAGFKRIIEICNEMPQEWTIIQLCKSFNPATTYSMFKEIYDADGAIFLTLLKHCRSPDYPPICMRFPNQDTSAIFNKYGAIIERFKSCIAIDNVDTSKLETKQKYWKMLGEFTEFLENCIKEFRTFFHPWTFLFKGRRYQTTTMKKYCKTVLTTVDAFCDEYKWDAQRRVLLSQAALHVTYIPTDDLQAICHELSTDHDESQAAYCLLDSFIGNWRVVEGKQKITCKKSYPSILIVDERLDHFFWEQLDVHQEFTRVKSLHNLWHLYKHHRERIKHGYFTIDLKAGYCVINPDCNLPNSGRRLRGFFEYWLPHWWKCIERRPTEQMLLKDAFQMDCFVYAGHGSGLQYLSGKQISKALISSVVFLFGCDSTRLASNGLYSAMMGTHNYYHAALCPTVIGTLMPALDANMDTVAVHLLSRWIAPTNKKDVMPWNLIDRTSWIKTGAVQFSATDIKPGGTVPTMETTKEFHYGSLCEILTHVQQRLAEPKIYNSCIYVSRGLPAWNTNVQAFPF